MDSMVVQALYPLLAIAVGIVVLMTQTAIKRDPQWALVISLITLAGSLWLAINNWPATPITATPLMLVDGYARLFTVVLTLAALVTVVIGRHWLMRNEGDQHEFFMLVLISTFGGVVLAHAQHFASFLLGLEILSVAIYTLIAYPDKSWVPIEAGLKYLVLSSASTAILLFGFALLYAATGALGFSELGERLANRNPLLIGTATLMIFSGLGFKLSLVPFHMWTPDVYEGAPTPVTGFLATVSKVAIFAGLLRWYDSAQLWQQPVLTEALAALAIASMLVGNFLALKQDDLKRLLGYSSIAHMGYLLVALVVLGGLPDTELAMEASVWYLVAYTASTLAAFAALSVWQTRAGAVTGSTREDASGMFWQEPLVALLMTIALLSLAGVPLTAGFIAKFYVVASGIEAGYWSLLSALVLGSAVSIFYYLRVIYAMSTQPDAGASGERIARSLVNLVFIGLLLAVLVLGIYPEPLIDIVRQTL
jgi:NADH-quinone oxidoreductase subunit N